MAIDRHSSFGFLILTNTYDTISVPMTMANVISIGFALRGTLMMGRAGGVAVGVRVGRKVEAGITVGVKVGSGVEVEAGVEVDVDVCAMVGAVIGAAVGVEVDVAVVAGFDVASTVPEIDGVDSIVVVICVLAAGWGPTDAMDTPGDPSTINFGAPPMMQPPGQVAPASSSVY